MRGPPAREAGAEITHCNLTTLDAERMSSLRGTRDLTCPLRSTTRWLVALIKLPDPGRDLVIDRPGEFYEQILWSRGGLFLHGRQV